VRVVHPEPMTAIGITGHRGLSGPTERLVAAALRAEVARHADGELVGVSSIADGADSLFATAVLDAGGTLVVIVPARRYRDALPPRQQPVYDALLARAARVVVLDHEDPTDVAYMDGGLRILDEIDRLVAVWDGQEARGLGGTAHLVGAAEERGLPVTVIWPAGAVR
jgi:hypothetical protein